MTKKLIVSVLIVLSLMVSEVFSLDCYECSTIGDAPCTTVRNCEEHYSQLGPNYVCRKVVTTDNNNVTSIDKGCSRPDFCDKMIEENAAHDTCQICTRNRCNSSVSLHGSLTVVSLIGFLSVIFVAK